MDSILIVARNVRISQCTVNSPWDDAIVLKASYGLGRFQDTENVTISDCYVSGYDKGSVLEGTWQLDEPQAPIMVTAPDASNWEQKVAEVSAILRLLIVSLNIAGDWHWKR